MTTLHQSVADCERDFFDVRTNCGLATERDPSQTHGPMRPFTRDDLRSLLSRQTTPCVSIFIPVARGATAAASNSLRFKNALKEAESKLVPATREAGLKALAHLAKLDDSAFWGEQRAAFAAFATADAAHYFRLGESTDAMTVVADTFYTKPLVKYLQGEIRYYVLSVTKENVTLWEGGRDSLDAVVVPGMPRGLRELEEGRGKDYIAGVVRSTGPGRSVHGGGEPDPKSDLKSLFRAVDRALLAYTHDERTPLVLATFEHYASLFHEVSKNPQLLDEGIHGDPASQTREQLRDGALGILKPLREAAFKSFTDQYNIAVNLHRGTNYPPNIAKAAVYGRVRTLLIEDGRTLPGTVDRTTGEVIKGDAGGIDLLDDIGELVIASGGDVYVLPKALMPTDVGVAAIYRY